MSRKPFESPAGLSAGSFARLEVCLLAMMHRLSDDQVLELRMMAGQYIGFGRVLAMLQLEIASCPI